MQDLKTIPLFAELTDKQLSSVSHQLRAVEQPEGAEVMCRGAGGVGFMIILEGEAEVTNPKGRTHKLGPGDYFGEMALLDDGGRSATVTALTDLHLVTIPEWSFKPFLLEYPQVAYRLLQTLTRRVREAEAD
jgi:CRP-like cAMP-binding protein